MTRKIHVSDQHLRLIPHRVWLEWWCACRSPSQRPFMVWRESPLADPLERPPRRVAWTLSPLRAPLELAAGRPSERVCRWSDADPELAATFVGRAQVEIAIEFLALTQRWNEAFELLETHAQAREHIKNLHPIDGGKLDLLAHARDVCLVIEARMAAQEAMCEING